MPPPPLDNQYVFSPLVQDRFTRINRRKFRGQLQGLRGHIEGVTFRNIRATANPLRIELKGFDETHAVEQVGFEDVVVNRRPLAARDVSTNAFVRNVTIRP